MWLILSQIEGLLDALPEGRPRMAPPVSAAFIVLMAALWPLAAILAAWDVIELHRWRDG